MDTLNDQMTSINTPKLRFPEFSGEWEKKKLGEVSEKINSGKTPLGGESVYTETGVLFIRSQNVNNDRLELDNVTFISDQINEGMNNSVVKPNDILLNITGASLGRSCVVSENFITGNVNQHVCIIRLKSECNPRFVQPILSSEKGQNIFNSLQTGSGREGLNFESIKSIEVTLPSLPEQQKIASFLTAVGEKLQALKKKKSLLEQYKKGVMQRIFNDESSNDELRIRFKDDNGNEFPEWEVRKLGEVCDEHLLKNTENKYPEVFSVAKHKGVINQIEHLGRSFSAKEISHYKLIYPGDMVYTKSPTADFPYGIIKQNRTGRIGVVSPLYCVFKPNTYALGYILHEYFSSEINVYNYLNPLVQKGAKNTMNINNDVFLNGAGINLPSDNEEQTKIANFLSAIDEKLSLVNGLIEKMEVWKKGLLQRMFV